MESPQIHIDSDSQVLGTIELTKIHYPFGYNVGEARMVLRTADETTELRKVKAVITNDAGNLNLVSIVGKNFAVIPNQLVLDTIADVSRDLNLSTLQSTQRMDTQ